MNITGFIKGTNRRMFTIHRKFQVVFLVVLATPIFVCIYSCETEREHESPWFTYSISEYVEAHPEEFSMFNEILEEGKLWNTLSGYNPYGEGYTLFLPDNEAITNYLEENQYVGSLGELLLDTGFLKSFARYHTVTEKIHTEKFPFGALEDRTMTGDRLTFNFVTVEENPLIKVNNEAPIIKANLEMANGYIHVISEVLLKTETSGYDWLQQQEEYSILAQAMKLTGMKERLMWRDSYTILAEHDSVYHRNGIFSVDDLIQRIDSSETPYTEESSVFNRFTAYHILSREYYLNDFDWGINDYRTMSGEYVMINAGIEIKINPGITTYGMEISEFGDTTVIDYIGMVWEACNLMTGTGPVHTINEILVEEPFPEPVQ